MLSFFATLSEDGSYALTTAGYTAFIVGMIAVLLLASLITTRVFGRESRIGARQLAFSAMAIALAMVASMVPMPRMPFGGHITLFSLLFITLIGYWYGLAGGIACGVAYGTLQLILDPYILSIPQLICDYILAFGALGLSGLFSGKVRGELWGYLVGVAGRYCFAVLSGIIFFASYAPSEGVLSNPVYYSLVYNLTYIGAEAALTAALLNIPAVRSAIASIKRLAVGE